MNSYIELGIAAFVPVIASIIFCLLETKTKFNNLPYFVRQIIIGIIFGGIAILGTEYGIPMNGAMVNCRDAAPLCAGLLFGAPAGIIAGTIGAIERWFAVYWGVGAFTRTACTLATFIAGIYAAILKKFLFDNKRPTWTISFAAGVIIEVFHLSLVFLTNMHQTAKAAEVIRVCTIPMITAVGLSVLFSAISVAGIANEGVRLKRKDLEISQTVQRWLLICVVIAFLATTAFLNMVQTGVAESQARELLTQTLNNATPGHSITTIGETGYTAVQRNGEIFDVSKHKEMEIFTTGVWGSDSFVMYKTQIDGSQLVAIYPVSEANATRDIFIYVNTFMEVLAFAVIFLLVYLLIKRFIVEKMHKINDGLEAITSGDLSVRIDVQSNKEFSELSAGINHTVDALKGYIAEAEARIDKELQFAKDIQAAALPNLTTAFTERPEFEIFASMDPAKEVGGDFFDFYYTREGKLNFLIADVSGKGIPAAMFMMRAKTQIKALAETGMSVEEAFQGANNGLCEGNEANMFVTAWMGSVDLEKGSIEFSNAGHNTPVLKHKDGTWKFIKNPIGFVLAGMEGVKYRKGEHPLRPGDTLFVYTDGVTEANNIDNELFGDDRLLDALNSCDSDSMEGICKHVKKCVDEFAGKAPQFDDITMLAVRYNGPPPRPEITFENSQISDITAITDFVETELENIDCPLKVITQINIAIDEIYSNIVKYGYRGTSGPATVRLEHQHEPNGILVTFIDEGIPYNPLNAKEPDVTLSAEERSIGGLGIYMVKQSMDEIIYEYKDGKNILYLFKNF